MTSSADLPPNDSPLIRFLRGLASAPVQVYRIGTWAVFQVRAREAARVERERVRELGRAMHKHGVGEHLVLEALTTLERESARPQTPAEQKARPREIDRLLLQLGSSGLLGIEPPAGGERAYDDAKEARDERRRWEARSAGTAARIWPATPVDWLALLGSYLLWLAVLLLVLAFAVPSWVPEGLVRLVNPGAIKPPVADGQMTGQLGPVTVKLKSAQIGRTLPPPPGQTAKVTLPQPCLVVVVEVANPSGRALEYRTWRGVGGANVVDDRGNSCPQVVAAAPAGVADRTTIPAGGTAEDTFLYVPPVAGYTYLDLFLPGANVGAAETLRLRIPAADITSTGD